jgi:hypothetical protein
MKKWIYLLAAISVFNVAGAQKVNWKKINSLDPDLILRSQTPAPTQVLLLGTFHFDYPNKDAHKTDSADYVDVLSPQRQREIKELAEVIKRFKPTRVYIESRRQSFHDSLYAQYRAGKYQLERNEIFQVGYRVAAEQGLEGVYAVDASSFLSENYKKIPQFASDTNPSPAVDARRDRMWQQRYSKLYDAGDSIDKELTILENYLFMANPKIQRRDNGAYLTTGFATTNNDGPDYLATWWYSRNLRIFNNILKTRPAPADRIVVLFGNGHMAHLNEFFRSSPEFEVVELKDLVNQR